VSATFGVFLD
jgi:hypothetical protein